MTANNCVNPHNTHTHPSCTTRSLSWKLIAHVVCAITITLAVVQQTHASDSTLHVNDATIVMPVPSARVMAGYALLMNHSDSTQTLVSVSSDAFARVEMHKSVIENDVAKMRKQKALTIPPHGSLQLEQGGLHLMLMQPSGQLNVGDEVTLEFNFENGANQSVAFKIVSLSHQSGDVKHDPKPDAHDHHSNHTGDHSNHGTEQTTKE